MIFLHNAYFERRILKYFANFCIFQCMNSRALIITKQITRHIAYTNIRETREKKRNVLCFRYLYNIISMLRDLLNAPH